MADKKPTNSYVHVCAAAYLFVYAPHGYSTHESQKKILPWKWKHRQLRPNWFLLESSLGPLQEPYELSVAQPFLQLYRD